MPSAIREEPAKDYELAPDYLFHELQFDIKITHNVMERCLVSIKENAINVLGSQVPAFLGFVNAFAKVLVFIQNQENSHILPLLSQHGVGITSLESENTKIHAIVNRSRFDENSLYDPQELLQFISELEAVLLPHYRSIEGLINLESIVSLRILRKEIENVTKKMQKEFLAYDQSIILPLVTIIDEIIYNLTETEYEVMIKRKFPLFQR